MESSLFSSDGLCTSRKRPLLSAHHVRHEGGSIQRLSVSRSVLQRVRGRHEPAPVSSQ